MKNNQSAVAGGVSTGTGGNAATGRAGLGQSGLGASGGQRLPVAPRERKPALAALAVLLMLGGALTSAYLVMASGQRVSAIQIVQPVAAGERIPKSAMREIQVGDTGVEYFLRWDQHLKVEGSAYAAVPLVPGTLLTNSMLNEIPEAARGRVVVGLSLKPGQLPATRRLRNGSRVSLYAVGTGAGSAGPRPGTLLAANAYVLEMGGNSGKSDRLRGDLTAVSVSVLPGEAAAVAQAASAGAVALALLPEKVQAAPQQPTTPGTEKPENPGTGNQTPGTGNQSPGTGNGNNGTGNNGTGNGTNGPTTGPGGN